MTMDSSSSTRVSKTDADFKELIQNYDALTDPPTNGYIINRFLANKKIRNTILLNTLMLELSKLSNPVPWDVNTLDFKVFQLHIKYMRLRKQKGKNWDKIVAFLAEDLKLNAPKQKKIKIITEAEETEQETLGPRLKSLCKHCQEKDKLNEGLSLQIEKLKVRINEVRRQYDVKVVNQKQKYMSECLKKKELKISKLKLQIWKLNKNLTEKNKKVRKLKHKSENISESLTNQQPEDSIENLKNKLATRKTNFKTIDPIQAVTIEFLKKKLQAKKASLRKQKKEIEKLKILTLTSKLNCQTGELT